MLFAIYAAIVTAAGIAANHFDLFGEDNGALVWFAVIAGLAGAYGLMGLRFVKTWERVTVFRFGNCIKAVGPGPVWIDSLFHTYGDTLDVNDSVVQVEMESVPTKDNVMVSQPVLITMSVDPRRVVDFTVMVDDGYAAVQMRAIAASTDIIGKKDLAELLHSRDVIATEMTASLADRVREWGVIIKKVELGITEIGDEKITESLAMTARVSREAEAALVHAKMQAAIAAQLSAAAAAMTPEAWRLKNLEVLEALCRSGNNNTILIPTDMVTTGTTAALAQALGKK